MKLQEISCSFIAPFVTNCILLIATVYRSSRITKQLDGTKLPVLKRLVSDGAFYFACIVAVSGLNVYFQVRESILSFSLVSLSRFGLVTLADNE